ncbi:MAG: hypothetical protein QOG03_482, partial [Actinomycetota bacterium]|nr:hypothetical protein [Actinomycetota bacterium]
MGKRGLVIGGSVAGLASAVALARRGWTMTVIERDPPPETDSGDEAFTSWDRRNVPQFHQPHLFSSRSRNLLLEYIPQVVDQLHADGIEESNTFKMLAPPDLWTADDDQYTGFLTRRPAFELALRLVAEAEPGVEIRGREVVDGLLYADAADDHATDATALPTVTGVRLRDGTELTADLVLDCGGRRSPVAKWLAADCGVTVPEEIQTTSTTYYTRYYRQRPESMLNQLALFAIRGVVENIAFAGFTGDHGTFGISYFVADHDDELKVLRHNWAWETAGRLFPMIEPWLDPANSEPIHDVQVMAGNVNSRRRYVVDGEPLVLGLLAVGDSLCTTNPAYGWGASMALSYAFAASEAFAASGGDLRRLALAYDEAVAAEA